MIWDLTRKNRELLERREVLTNYSESVMCNRNLDCEL